MRELIYAVALVIVVAAQVSVAPLFRFAGAEFELVLLYLLILLLIEGPRPAMVATPIAAILLAFAAGRAPGLVLLSFLPLVVVAAWLDELRLPVTRSAVVAASFVSAGAWARLVMAIAAMFQGTEVAAGTLIFDVLLAGAVLDLALLAVAVGALRLVGSEQRPLSLGGARY